MAFLLRKPFIIIIAVIIASVLIVFFSGILPTKPAGLTLSPEPTLKKASIKIGENTTLTVVIENKASQSKTFELHIVYSGNLTFYDGITNKLLTDISKYDIYYNLTYPTKGTLDVRGSTSIPILVKGLKPIGASQTHTITVEVFSLEGSKNVLADKKEVQLIVNLQ